MMYEAVFKAFKRHDSDRHLILEDAIRAEIAAHHDDSLTVGHISALLATASDGDSSRRRQFDCEVL